MPIDIMTSLAALSQATNIAKTIIEMDNRNERVQAVTSILHELFEAKASQLSLQQQISDLETKVSEFESFEREKEKHELYELGPGVFCYRTKEGGQSEEPAHNLCANCYGKRNKSILQFQVRDPGRWQTYVCLNCKSELRP